MKSVSIEYAHIYTNNKIGGEHELSLHVLGSLFKQEESLGHDASLVIMVDDYSFPDPSFDYDGFITWLSEKGFKPDVLFRESQLIPLCDEVVKFMTDEKLKEQISDYIRSKKYPCSLFIAAWYLLRLGHLQHASFDKEFNAEKLINILPESFKPFEDKALEIIAATPFSSSVSKINHKYFEGRLVA
jgi:hypothetical protein